jgi:hypothetical protein
MERVEVSGAVRPLKWPLGVKWLTIVILARLKYKLPDKVHRPKHLEAS